MPRSLLPRFAAAVARCGVQPTDRLAVALSGGPDSLALAAMTVQWQRANSLQQEPPLALIVDHGLRPESAAEAAAVAAQAEQLGLAARVLGVAWPGNSPPARGRKMAAARDARYALLLSACAADGRRRLLVAHHADDQAETFLLRLMHASGVAGLACMPAAVERQTEAGPVTLARPFLGFRKAELEFYCQQEGLPYVSDPTNADLSFQRNLIRHLLHTVPAGAAQAGGGGDSSGSRIEAGSAAGSFGSSSLGPPGSSGGEGRSLEGQQAPGNGNQVAGSLVDDILLLQRRCEAVAARQEAAAGRLLRQAVLHTSCAGLAACQPAEQSWQGQQLEQTCAKRPAAQRVDRGPWAPQEQPHPEWGSRLLQVAGALRPFSYALLDVRCFAGAEEAAALASLSSVLRAVSGRRYPPGHRQLLRLHSMLRTGTMRGAFTGGGCLVRPLAGSKGRYVLCVAQADRPQVERALEELRQRVDAARAERGQLHAAANGSH